MTRNIAGEIMYELARERGLLDPIIMLCKDAREKGGKIDTHEWKISGLLNYLGQEIYNKDKSLEFPGNK